MSQTEYQNGCKETGATWQTQSSVGVGFALLFATLSLFGCTPSYSSTPASFPGVNNLGSDHATDEARMRSLGSKQYPTNAELREYVILEGRQGVREGQWTKGDFERYTGEKFPK